MAETKTTVDQAARHALVEAQIMAGSIAHIVERLIDNCTDGTFHDLEAILACTQRIEAAVDPVIDAGPAEVSHG